MLTDKAVPKITVRTAAAGDIAELADRDARLIGVEYRWAERLGDGATVATNLALVATDDDSGRTVGHIGVTPISLSDMQILHSGRSISSIKLPWWKIHALAVEPDHTGQGIARALLAETVARMPATLHGLYGNVEDDRGHEIAWYRRQGFYIATALNLSTADGELVGAHPDQGEVYFSASRRDLLAYLAGRPPRNIEQRAAAAELKMWLKGTPPAPDLGFRLFARRIAEETTAAPRCPHADMGARVLWVAAFDPEHHWVCQRCMPDRLDSVEISGINLPDWCDGCSRRRPHVITSFAVCEDIPLVVMSGLCANCRAGTPPSPN